MAFRLPSLHSERYADSSPEFILSEAEGAQNDTLKSLSVVFDVLTLRPLRSNVLFFGCGSAALAEDSEKNKLLRSKRSGIRLIEIAHSVVTPACL